MSIEANEGGSVNSFVGPTTKRSLLTVVMRVVRNYLEVMGKVLEKRCIIYVSGTFLTKIKV